MEATGIVSRVVKMFKRFYDGFVEFADYGFRYVDAPWFSDYQKPNYDGINQREGKKISA